MLEFGLTSDQQEESVLDHVVTNPTLLSELIVYNDDHNTFDWVIQCLMDICNHEFEQSEQLSLIVHYKGKAVVKTADLDILSPMKNALIDRGLSAVIESCNSK